MEGLTQCIVLCTNKMDVELLDQRLEYKQADDHFRGGVSCFIPAH